MKTSRLAVLLAVVAGLGFVMLAVMRDSLATTRGDEGTYRAMIESLVRDGDLEFGSTDRERIEQTPVADGAVILQAAGGRLAYSKPVVYPLMAAPFAWAFGAFGPIALNAIAFSAALALSWIFLRRLGGGSLALLTLVTFAGASVLPVYLVWRMGDSLQASLVMAGTILAVAALRPAPRPSAWDSWLDRDLAAGIGGALLGLATAMRWPSALSLVAVVAALVCVRRWRRAAWTLAGAGVVVGLALTASWGLTGTASPYRAVRATFNGETGHPISVDEPLAQERFEAAPATQTMGWMPRWRPALTGYSSLYFWIGRHTGVLVYFPAFVLLLAAACRFGDRASWMLLGGVVGSAVFYLVWWPDNYFGGSTFVGNRYFLAAYPAVIAALGRLPSRRALLATWVLAGAVAGSAWLSLSRLDDPARSSQSHAYAGIFRSLPFESTARRIDGVKDRYWIEDLLRWTDPYARVSGDGFALAPGVPPAEALLVTRPEVRSVLLRLGGKLVGGELTVESPGYTQLLPLEVGGQMRSTVEIRLPPAWRRHRFWWDRDQEYAAHVLRFSVREPSSGGLLSVRYGGDAEIYLNAFDARFPKVQLPDSVAAGSVSELSVEVRNMSPSPWLAGGPFRTGLTVWLQPEVGGYRSKAGVAWLTEKVESGDLLNTPVDVRWPVVPGRYRLWVDLTMAGLGSYSQRGSALVAEGVVGVAAAEAVR